MSDPLPRRQFASDNYAGIAPEAWEAMHQANQRPRTGLWQ